MIFLKSLSFLRGDPMLKNILIRLSCQGLNYGVSAFPPAAGSFNSTTACKATA